MKCLPPPHLHKVRLCRTAAGGPTGGVSLLAGVVLTGLALCVTSSGAAQSVTIPDQNTPVIDQAKVLDAGARQQLVDLLESLKDKTGAQIKVLTVPSLAGEDIFAFAQRHYDLWKLGKKGSDKGALIVLAPTEHKVRIHVGYGLEGILPDGWCGTQSRNVAKKYFARGAYAQGLIDLTQTVAQRVTSDKGAADLPAAAEPGGRDWTFELIVLVLVLIFLFNLYQQWKNRGNRRRWSRWDPLESTCRHASLSIL